MKQDLEKRIRETIDYLPPVPAIMADLIEALGDPELSLARLGEIIAKDPMMSVNILKVANSAFYRIPNRVSTIEHAVRMIGVRDVAALCLACSALNVLHPPKKTPSIDLTSFWRHSVATGMLAKLLCRELNFGLMHNIYLAGLVHDVGKVVLDRFAHEAYEEALDVSVREGIPLVEAEKRVIGESHDRVGGWLMEKWRLPQPYVNSARYHHSAKEVPERARVMVALVSFADHLTRMRDFGFGGTQKAVILKDTDAFKILEVLNPHLRLMDFGKFVHNHENIDEEIIEMEKLVSGL
jgi:putative nucleotidyltransferase with HDIG domain